MKRVVIRKGVWVIFVTMVIIGSLSLTQYAKNKAINDSEIVSVQATLRTLQTMFSKFNMRWLINDHLIVGVDLNCGGAIRVLMHKSNYIDLINNYDKGRNIQQSFYGDKIIPEIYYNGQPWPLNPVQGGNWAGYNSRVDSYSQSGNWLYIETTPLDWAYSYPVYTQSKMYQFISLHGAVLKIDFAFNYSGPSQNTVRHQEMPAPYFPLEYDHIHYYHGSNPWSHYLDWGNGYVNRWVYPQPGPTIYNEYSPILTEEWCAYTRSWGWGIGMYFPHANFLTFFRNAGSSGPNGSGASYFAPLQFFNLYQNIWKQYSVYMVIGNISDIRGTFRDIRNAGGLYLSSSDLKALKQSDDFQLQIAKGDEWRERFIKFVSGGGIIK